jgi:hypothetical protein
MGGATSQVALECKDCSGNSYTLYNNDYNLFADSLMCFGMEEQMRRFVAARIVAEIDSIDAEAGENNNKKTIQ